MSFSKQAHYRISKLPSFQTDDLEVPIRHRFISMEEFVPAIAYAHSILMCPPDQFAEGFL